MSFTVSWSLLTLLSLDSGSPRCHLNLSPSVALFSFCRQSFPASAKVKGAQLSLTLCNPIDCLWNCPGQNTGVGSHPLLQGIFPPQGSNAGLRNCRWILYHLSHQGSPPNVRVFSNESVLHIWWPWYWSFSISPSSEYSGLIYLRTDWIDLLAVQGTLKSLPQHHSLKASTLWCSAFFMVQSSHLYMTARKTIVFTIWTFVSKVMSLLLNTLCRFVITFLPRSKCLLISWL